MKRMRIALQASLKGAPDAIEFAGSIQDRMTELKHIVNSVYFSASFGGEPGEATLADVERVARSLLRDAWAYRMTR